MDQRLGLRAITMQQPFAHAFIFDVCLYTRRGKPVTFKSGGEWIAIHCGTNDEHLKNGPLMKEFRRVWPECPSDEVLRSCQGSILGLAFFVDGCCDAKAAASSNPLFALYACTKPVAWRADTAHTITGFPFPYPKGNLSVWHLQKTGFKRKADGPALLGYVPSGAEEEPLAQRQGKRPAHSVDISKEHGSAKKAKR